MNRNDHNLSPSIRLFCTLFWIGFFYNVLKDGGSAGYAAGWSRSLAVSACVFAFLFCGDRRVVSVAHGLQLIAYALSSPHYSNFHMTCSLVSLVWLGSMAFSMREERFRSGVLIVLVLTYLFAGFIKINASFLDPHLSPARALLESHAWLSRFMWRYLDAPAREQMWVAASRLVAVGILALELLMPCLLLSRRTRLAGMGLEWLLHLLMGIRSVPFSMNFPFLFTAVWVLWLPKGGLGFLGLRGLRSLVGLGWPSRLGLGLLILILALDGAVLPKWLSGKMTIGWLWFGLMAIWIFGWIQLVRKRLFWNPVRFFEVRYLNPVVVPIGLFVICIGVSPYLGIRTMGAYEMYSGYLHIGGRSNHYLVPAMPSWRHHHTQRWVIVLESSDPLLQAYASQPIAISWNEFQRLASGALDASVVYWEQGNTHVVRTIASDPELAQAPTWIKRYAVNTMKVPAPRLKELDLLTPAFVREPRARDTLYLVPVVHPIRN